MKVQRGGCHVKQRGQAYVLQGGGQLPELGRSVTKEASEKLEHLETKAGGLHKCDMISRKNPRFPPIPPKLLR